MLVEIKSWEPGVVIRDRYRVLSDLGSGGMGVVYKAVHIKLDKVCALKVMSAGGTGDPQSVKRFRREAKAASEVNHVNCVHVYDFDEAEDGNLFIAMDYVDGGSLRQLLNSCKGPLRVERAVNIARGVAEGLAAAHLLHIVHRDIKPENILLARDAQEHEIPKISDFGIVAMTEGSSTLTVGVPMLTPKYAAPEQWLGMKADELDGRTDIYALGGVLYEMLTGETPFRADNDGGWMRQHLSETPKPLSALRPELGGMPGLDALVLRLLAKKSDDRPASVQAFLQELNVLEVRRYALTGTHTPGVTETKALASTVQLAPPSKQQDGQMLGEEPPQMDQVYSTRHKALASDSAQENHRKTSTNVLVVLLVAGALCAVIGLGAWLWRSADIPTNRPTNVAPIEHSPQPSPGGEGSIALLPMDYLQAGVDDKVEIRYSVDKGTGSGISDFRCEVRSPDGADYTSHKLSTPWSDGRAYASFTFPFEFTGSHVPNAKKLGKYWVHCFWYVNANSVEGAIADAKSEFTVGKQAPLARPIGWAPQKPTVGLFRVGTRSVEVPTPPAKQSQLTDVPFTVASKAGLWLTTPSDPAARSAPRRFRRDFARLRAVGCDFPVRMHPNRVL
jgi:serine/threonine protein kinase